LSQNNNSSEGRISNPNAASKTNHTSTKDNKQERGVFDEFSRQNLFNAFHSRLFVDDCDLNVKIKALQEI